MFESSQSHLNKVNETYLEHQKVAFTYGFTFLKAAIMAFMHGIIPGVFQTSSSDLVSSLTKIRK